MDRENLEKEFSKLSYKEQKKIKVKCWQIMMSKEISHQQRQKLRSKILASVFNNNMTIIFYKKIIHIFLTDEPVGF